MKTVPVSKSTVVAEAMAAMSPKAAMSTVSAAAHKRHVAFSFRELREGQCMGGSSRCREGQSGAADNRCCKQMPEHWVRLLDPA